ncbi:MAG TPA: hypothetical protein VE713_07170 [Pyrinomonadaceae bacterium]|jgi:hypothetical protein|nr:hypothetical protein [Pyrinomonadaceae bacterium]
MAVRAVAVKLLPLTVAATPATVMLTGLASEKVPEKVICSSPVTAPSAGWATVSVGAVEPGERPLLRRGRVYGLGQPHPVYGWRRAVVGEARQRAVGAHLV